MPTQTASFVDLEIGRSWADYDENEPLPTLLFGITVVKLVVPDPPIAPVDLSGWQTVKSKKNRKVSFFKDSEGPRQKPWIHGECIKL
jgi:hypothetical protein